LQRLLKSALRLDGALDFMEHIGKFTPVTAGLARRGIRNPRGKGPSRRG
jgi:hypothetical protein